MEAAERADAATEAEAMVAVARARTRAAAATVAAATAAEGGGGGTDLSGTQSRVIRRLHRQAGQRMG